MPKPEPNETRDHYMSRCIPMVLDHGTASSQEQAVAICESMWRQHRRKELIDHGRKIARGELH